MFKTIGYAAQNSTSPLGPFTFERRDPGPRDVQIEILYCGVCHSDLHLVRNEWGKTEYPIVPGHEITGRVIQVGNQVQSFKAGDLAAVGVMVDSCRNCAECNGNLEQFCRNETIFTYNSPDKHSGKMTYGGYSTHIVVNEHFVFHISGKLDPAGAAPLLCAGITTYSPLRHWNVGAGNKVGIVGLGGLGHMAVKLAHAMGAHVVLFTTSPGKIQDAIRLGANEVVISSNPDEMQNHLRSFDFILNTVAAAHKLDAYLELLKRDGTMCLVGIPAHPHPALDVGELIFMRRQLAGSLIGGIQETQEMLDFCAEHNIVSEIEMIPMQGINEAYERMLRNDVKYRFVIDIASLR